MNAQRIIAGIKGYLAAEAAPEGVVSIAATGAAAMHALASQAPTKFGLCLVWGGFSGMPDKDLPTWQEHALSLFVRIPKGVAVIPGTELLAAQSGQSMSVLDTIEWARLAMCRLRLVDEDGHASIDPRGILFEGSEWVQKDSEAESTDVHELRFSLCACLDVAASTETVEV